MPCELDDAVMYHSDLLCSLMAFFLQVLEILLADSLQLSASFRKIACPVALSPRSCLLFQGSLCCKTCWHMHIKAWSLWPNWFNSKRSPGFRAPLRVDQGLYWDCILASQLPFNSSFFPHCPSTWIDPKAASQHTAVCWPLSQKSSSWRMQSVTW